MNVRRAVRIGLTVLVLVAIASALARYAGQLGDGLADLSPAWTALAALAVLVGSVCSLLSWRALLADLGSPLPLRAAGRVFFLGQLGKYLPGSVWPVLAQMELGKRYGVPRKRAAAATVVTIGLSVMAGAVVALTSVVAAPGLLREYWWALLALPVGAVVLHPPVFSRLADTALQLARRQPLEHPLTRRGELRALAWAVASWTAFGVQVWALARGLGATGPKVLPLSVAGFALAWTAGFLVVFLPAGAGVREAVLVLALGPVLARPEALALALVSRLLMTVGDVLLAAVGGAVGGPGPVPEQQDSVAAKS